MKSTHQIIAYVLNCSHTIAPNGTSHMKVGYTDLSVMSHDGIVHLTGSDYDLLEKDIDELLIYEGFSESVGPRPRAKRQVAPTWRRHQAPSGLWNMYNVFFRPNSESHSKRNTIHMPVSPSGKGLGRCARLGPETDSNLPSSWDWRHYGVVPAVRNQITCGSCWAFVTTQQIEAAHLKAKKPRTWGEHLSPQQIVDHDNQV